jgi:hypothetical protein
MLPLTVGFATHKDPRASQTLKNLAMYHATGPLVDAIQFVVIDTSPDTPYGDAIRAMCVNLGRRVKYVSMPENLGTTQPRERIFREADGDAVLVMDCHVNPYPGTLERLIRYYAEHPDCLDLLSGPLVYDNGYRTETHFADQWRGQMRGVWARDERIEPMERWLEGGCFTDQPEIEPFEIPGMGLGMFTCRRSAWLGFNSHFRGFGGEEMYIHEKFRRAGRKAICLPWLLWWHDFSRPWGASYRNDLRDRVRNYVLGAIENGESLDPIYKHFVSLEVPAGMSLADHLLQEHGSAAVTPDAVSKAISIGGEALNLLHRSVKLPENLWQQIVANPERVPEAAQAKAPLVQISGKGQKHGRVQPPPDASLDAIYQWGREVAKRDIDQDFPLLKEWSGKVARVTEFTKRRESTIALAAGRPTVLISHQLEDDDIQPLLHQAILADSQVIQSLVATDNQPRRFIRTFSTRVGGPDADSLKAEPIAETDLLYFDTVHSAARLTAELDRHGGQVKRAIIIRGTRAFGEHAEGSTEPGLFPAIKQWLLDHPEWFVAGHSFNQYGMTVLSRNEEDRPPAPIFPWPKGEGPGTEMQAMLKEIGVEAKPNCGCKAMAQRMDMLGPDGCRKEREQIVKSISENAEKWSWYERVQIAAKMAVSGVAWKLSPLDPYGSLFDVALARAEAKERAQLADSASNG